MKPNSTDADRPRNRWVENVLYIITIMWLFAFFVWIAVPHSMKNEKRSRTAHAVYHADKLCGDIRGRGSDKNAALVSPGRVRGYQIQYEEGLQYQINWLENNEPRYRFEFFVDGKYGSSIHNPVVVATARTGPDSMDVFADVVQSGGDGMVSGWDLSNCKTTFEVVSKNYDPGRSKAILQVLRGRGSDGF